MKRKLVAIIIILSLVTLTLGGVSYAYFSVSDTGGDQNITIGHFDFSVTRADADGAVLGKEAPLSFKAPTVINFPVVTALTEDGSENPDYAAYGDDPYFNEYCIAVTARVTNECAYPVTAGFDVTAASAGGADFSAAVKFFPFAKTALTGDTAAELRAAIPPVTDAAKNPAENSEASRIAALRDLAFDLPAGATGEYTLVLWLDYTAMKAVTGDAFAAGTFTVNMRVTVRQAVTL